MNNLCPKSSITYNPYNYILTPPTSIQSINYIPLETQTEYINNSAKSAYPRIKSINIGLCSFSGTAELAITPYWSLLLTGSSYHFNPDFPGNNSGKISLESRKYFDSIDDKRRGFVSFRFGSSKNIGSVFGVNFTETNNTGFAVHVGAYTNLKHITCIKPTMGISFYLNNY